MSQRILTILVLITGLTFSATAFAKEPKAAWLPNMDREVTQIADGVFQLKIELDEEVDFDAQGIKRVAIDESRFADFRVQDEGKRLVLTGRSAGKAVILLFASDGSTTTLIVTVAGEDARPSPCRK